MKILHVIPAMTWDRGGPAAVVRALAGHQQALGHQPAVLTTDQGLRRGERAIEMPPGIEMRRARVAGPDRLAYAPTFSDQLRSMLSSADVMHVHSIFRYPCLAAIKCAAKLDKPVVVRPCGVLHRYSLGSRSAVLKALFLKRHGAMYRSVCDAWHYTSASEKLGSWPWENLHGFVAPNGIDPQPYAVNRCRARQFVHSQWPETEGRDYVLFLGRLHAKKRIDLLLEAFLEAAPARYKLVVAGPDEGRLWPKLQRRYLRNRRDRERVVRLGLVTGEHKRCLLAGATLFALASEHENFGNAVLEALATGTPVLGTAQVDLINELADEKLAYIADAHPAIWKQQLAMILDRPPAVPRFAQAARQVVARRYAWACVARQITDEYQQVL